MRLEIDGCVLSFYEDEYRELLIEGSRLKVTNLKNCTKFITFKLPVGLKPSNDIRLNKDRKTKKHKADIPAAITVSTSQSASTSSLSTLSSSQAWLNDVQGLEAKFKSEVAHLEEQFQGFNSIKSLTDTNFTKSMDSLRSDFTTTLKQLEGKVKTVSARVDTYGLETGLLQIKCKQAESMFEKQKEEIDKVWRILETSNQKGPKYK